MNKKSFWTFLLFALILTACASNTRTPDSASSGISPAMELPTQTKLILGVINLEETDYVITTEQAEELLPMFYVLQDLNESDTAAQEEIDGLVNQIQETITEEQTQTIDEMSLSMQDMFALTRGNSEDSASSDFSSAPSFDGGGGVPQSMGAGGPPDMPTDGIPNNGNFSAQRDETNSMPAIDMSTPSILFDTVIELLQKKIQ